MKKTALLFTLPLLLLTYFLLLSPVLAQISTITVIPPRLELTADPGKTITATLKLRNETTSTQNYAIVVNNFLVSDDHGTPIPIPDSVNTRWNMKSWIKAPSVIPVDSKALASITIQITVPKDALPGGHYALITYQPNPDSNPIDLNKTGSLIGQRAGTIIYLTVSGPITQNASVIRFEVPKFNELGPVPFNGWIKNLSDLHINAKGAITITDFLGRQVSQIPVETGNIFPATERSFNALWNQKWGYGRYSANLSLAYGSAGGVLTASIFFWLFPIRLVIYGLVAIISILFVIIMLNKRNKKHEAELEKEVRELKKEVETLEKK